MSLVDDFRVGTRTAGRMIDNGTVLETSYAKGLESKGNSLTPNWLRFGCIPIAIGLGFTVLSNILQGSFEHIIPFTTAAIFLLGFGRILRKMRHTKSTE